MEIGLFLMTLGMCGLALFLGVRERTFIYLVALAAGSLGTLLSPVWQRLYQFSYNEQYAPLLTFLDRPLPSIIAVGGWTILLPALLVFYLARHRWWFGSYLTFILTFILFVLYHVLVESIGLRAGWWAYSERPTLPFGLRPDLIAALMNGLISLGGLAMLLVTRHYSLASLLVFLLPAPLALQLLVHGLLGAPLYTVLLLGVQETWIGTLGALGTVGLVLWGAHIIAVSITDQRNRRQSLA